jgi:hypothetical protein
MLGNRAFILMPRTLIGEVALDENVNRNKLYITMTLHPIILL